MSQIRSLSRGAIIALALSFARPSAAESTDVLPGSSVQPETGPTYWTRTLPAPKNALELSIGTGYTQGFGNVEKGRALNDTAEAGMSLDFGAGYRLSPYWMFGMKAAYQVFQAGNSLADQSQSPASGVGALQAGYHFAPFARLDPWLQVGAGYRYLCQCGQPGKDELLHGFELLDAKLGMAVRVDPQVALAPLIGADVSMFIWDRGSPIKDPRLNTFIYGGLQARFDLGGTSERREQIARR